MLPDLVEDDADLPKPLNTAAKQEKRAKGLAAAHVGKKAYSVQSPAMQGYFSRTRVVKMVGGDKIVIQFRIQPLDLECFRKARGLMGEAIPEIEKLHDDELEALGMNVYAMSYIPGCSWSDIPTSRTEARARIAASLGGILGRSLVQGDSIGVVDDYILPTLERFRDSLNDTSMALQAHIERSIEAAPQLKKLPLYFSHHDLNEMNVLIGEDNTVSGIVDWECAKNLPFGVGLHRVTDTIVAENHRNTIDIPEGSKEIERAFWDAVLKDGPAAITDNLELVQDALHIGALLFAFEEQHLGADDVRYLEGILTYRLPQLRGDAGPFDPAFLH